MQTTVIKIDAAFFEELQEAANQVNELKIFNSFKLEKLKLYKQFEDPTGQVHILIHYGDTNQIFYLGWHYLNCIKQKA